MLIGIGAQVFTIQFDFQKIIGGRNDTFTSKQFMHQPFGSVSPGLAVVNIEDRHVLPLVAFEHNSERPFFAFQVIHQVSFQP